MYRYYPVAIQHVGRGKYEVLATHKPVKSTEEAKEQFVRWRDICGYDLVKCWIDVFHGNDRAMIFDVNLNEI